MLITIDTKEELETEILISITHNKKNETTIQKYVLITKTIRGVITKPKTDIVWGIRTKGFQGMFQPVIAKEKLKEFQITTLVQKTGLKQKQVQKSLIGELGDPLINYPRQIRMDFGRSFFFPPFAINSLSTSQTL